MTNKPARPGADQANSLFPEVEPSSRSASLRGIIDSLLQASLVELYQAYGVACAPLPRDGRSGLTLPELSAIIGFTSSADGKAGRASGRLSLSMPAGLMELMQGDRAPQTRSADWSRELVNQLMGRFKNRLLPYGARLQPGLPTSIGRDALEAELTRGGTRRIYRARTRRGEVVAALDGTLNEADLAYTGPTIEASEGELILF